MSQETKPVQPEPIDPAQPEHMAGQKKDTHPSSSRQATRQPARRLKQLVPQNNPPQAAALADFPPAPPTGFPEFIPPKIGSSQETVDLFPQNFDVVREGRRPENESGKAPANPGANPASSARDERRRGGKRPDRRGERFSRRDNRATQNESAVGERVETPSRPTEPSPQSEPQRTNRPGRRNPRHTKPVSTREQGHNEQSQGGAAKPRQNLPPRSARRIALAPGGRQSNSQIEQPSAEKDSPPSEGAQFISPKRIAQATGHPARVQRNKPARGRLERHKPSPSKRSGKEAAASGASFVSLSGRYSANWPQPSVPIHTDQGIKLRSQRGGLSKNWWARRWIEAMERLVDPARLQRGRSYARSGQVLSITENKAGIEAKVQGSRPAPYRVSIQVTHLNKRQWAEVVNAMAEQALFTAQLLAGEMPDNIEDAFQTAGVSLFPLRPGDLTTSCSCPDWANPCKHVAATHYILGDRFDDDPFLLFRMRGRAQEQILDDLRLLRGGGMDMEEEETEENLPAAPSLADNLAGFWESAEDLDSFPLTITPPTVDMPILKRLGDPAFLSGDSLMTVLKPVYDSLTRYSLRAAYTDIDAEEDVRNP